MKINDYVVSDMAQRLGIDNIPKDMSIFGNIINLDRYVVEPLRKMFPDASIHIKSGYRCEALNKAMGGYPNSQHTKGQAVDLRCDITQFWKLAAALKCRLEWLSYDTCMIYTKSHYIHVSFVNHELNRNEYLEVNQ